MTDTRTPDEHLFADIAADTLSRLNKLDDELDYLKGRFEMLGYFTHQIDEDQGLQLLGAASTIQLLRSEGIKNLVRDVASKLPVRGLDY